MKRRSFLSWAKDLLSFWLCHPEPEVIIRYKGKPFKVKMVGRNAIEDISTGAMRFEYFYEGRAQ